MYVGQRLNKGGKCERLTPLLSLNTQTELWLLLVKSVPPDFFPHLLGKKNTDTCGQKHTQAAQKHARIAIVIHSTVRFSMSYPVSAVGSCPNKGALHSFTELLSSVSDTKVFFLQAWKRRVGAATFIYPIPTGPQCLFSG